MKVDKNEKGKMVEKKKVTTGKDKGKKKQGKSKGGSTIKLGGLKADWDDEDEEIKMEAKDNTPVKE